MTCWQVVAENKVLILAKTSLNKGEKRDQSQKNKNRRG